MAFNLGRDSCWFGKTTLETECGEEKVASMERRHRGVTKYVNKLNQCVEKK